MNDFLITDAMRGFAVVMNGIFNNRISEGFSEPFALLTAFDETQQTFEIDAAELQEIQKILRAGQFSQLLTENTQNIVSANL